MRKKWCKMSTKVPETMLFLSVSEQFFLNIFFKLFFKGGRNSQFLKHVLVVLIYKFYIIFGLSFSFFKVCPKTGYLALFL